jgi:hypothetical protein
MRMASKIALILRSGRTGRVSKDAVRGLETAGGIRESGFPTGTDRRVNPSGGRE